MARKLVLHLKKKWFDKIKRFEKLEEYREINDYWMKRLIKNGPKDGIKKGFMAVGSDQWREFSEIHFALGYPKQNDEKRWIRIYADIKIRVGTGKKEWGAESGKEYFIISWNIFNLYDGLNQH